MEVTYEVDGLSALKDSWNDLFSFNINDKQIPGKKPNKKKCKCKDKNCHCNDDKSSCKCDPDKVKKETQKEIQKMKNQVLKEVVKLIGESTDVDINKIVNAVIKKQKPHEDNQTNNINKNQQDIIDINSITIWDKDGNFDNNG